jgi:hypothetical protein
MKKILFILSITGAAFASCKQDAPAIPEPINYSFKEEFDTLAVAFSKGWVAINKSRPLGTANWAQGSTGKAFIGTAASNYSGQDCIYCSFSAGSGLATISNWLISPSVPMKNGDKISFFTATQDPVAFPDRLQVRLNPTNDATNVGNDATSVGGFSTLLLDINPALNATAYPTSWTNYTLTLSGLTGVQNRRFAFRYFVTNGGPSGANSNGIGIDEVEFISAN